MKVFLGIIIGILIVLSIKTAYAGNKTWKLDHEIRVAVEKFIDGNIVCYVAQSKYSFANAAISCVKVK